MRISYGNQFKSRKPGWIPGTVSENRFGFWEPFPRTRLGSESHFREISWVPVTGSGTSSFSFPRSLSSPPPPHFPSSPHSPPSRPPLIFPLSPPRFPTASPPLPSISSSFDLLVFLLRSPHFSHSIFSFPPLIFCAFSFPPSSFVPPPFPLSFSFYTCIIYLFYTTYIPGISSSLPTLYLVYTIHILFLISIRIT